jgi:hypothetical protein
VPPPQMPSNTMGERKAGFGGGTGIPINWPGIKPMWFSDPNPVSGRLPEHYWPECVTCVTLPSTSPKANGF